MYRRIVQVLHRAGVSAAFTGYVSARRSIPFAFALIATVLSGSTLAGKAPLNVAALVGVGAQSKPLPGYIPPPVRNGQATLKGAHSGSDIVTLTVTLALRNPGGLAAFLQAVNDPKSPQYHHYLTQSQLDQTYAPTVDQQNQVIAWLQSNNLTVTQTFPNRLLLSVQGTTADVEKTFNVTLQDYSASVHGRQQVFYAPNTNPSVDSSVGDIVVNVLGLTNYPRFRTFTATAHNAPAYYPQDFANAYDVNPLWNAGYNGAGQHIGITLWTVPPSDSTLQHVASVTGSSIATTANGRLKVIPVDGGTTAATSPDTGEAAMDIEYASGMAPGATIDYYEAPTDSTGSPTAQGLLDALNQAGTDANNNRVISSSWGGCEASSVTDPWTHAAESIFAANGATGHVYFFSSGDNGSWCDPTGSGTGQNPYPDYPASSPNVVSVGGTTFSSNISGSYPGESTWAYCATCSGGNPEGTGGGYSSIFSRPTWQTGSGLAGNGMRGYPDVSADADPSTGAYVCYGASTTCAQFGGTSLAAPLWAGMMAVANQYLAAQGAPLTGFLMPALYQLASTTQTYQAFHDVTSGTNGKYTAGSAWDPVTGWGSPDLYNLARDMAGSTVATPAPTSVAAAVPTAVPTTSTSGSYQLVVNGGVESGLTPWQGSSSGGKSLLTTTQPHSGASSIALCGYNSCNDQVWQAVILPTTFTKVTLSYWLYITTQQTTAYCYDAFHSRIRTSTGAIISTPRTMCNTNASNNWVQTTVDVTSVLSAYKGKQVQVYFQGTTNATLPTTFNVDDVTLTVTGSSGSVSAAPTPVPTSINHAAPTSTPTVGGTSCPGSQSACIESMLTLINKDRAQYGLPAFTLNATQSNGTSTCTGSYGHSTAMAQSGTIWHTNSAYPKASFPTDICLSYSTAGENVGEAASGNELSDLQTLNSQMMSEPHDASTCASTVNHACNLISTAFHQVGIGIDSANGVTWLTEDFTN